MVVPRAEEPADRSRSRDEACATYEELRAAFVASKGSHAVAALTVRLRRDEAKRRLTRVGLTSLRRLEHDKLKAVMSAVLDGNLTLHQACKSHRLSLEAGAPTLRQVMRPLETALDEWRRNRPASFGPKGRWWPHRDRWVPHPPPQCCSICQTGLRTLDRPQLQGQPSPLRPMLSASRHRPRT